MKTKNKIISAVIALLIFFWIISYTYDYFFVPGILDDFAKCSAQKGAVMYGAIEWCEFTQAQSKMFGKSFKFVNYKDYSEYPSTFGNIKKTPTWIINGKDYTGVQTIERLSQLTNCSLP